MNFNKLNLTPYEKWQAIQDKAVWTISALVISGFLIWASWKVGMEILLGIIILAVFLSFVLWTIDKDIKKKELLNQAEWDKKKREEAKHYLRGRNL